MTHDIHYGSAFRVDGFGFVQKGTIDINEATVRLSGRKHWPTLVRVGVFLAIFLPLFILFRIDILGIALALVVVHYACASRASVQLNRSQISEITRKGRRITFRASLEPGAKLRKSLFHARNEQDAIMIENALLSQE